MAIETELKLAIDPSNIAKFLNHPLVISNKKSFRKMYLHGTYFDTPDHQLFSQYISFRVRKEGSKWIQALKSFQANTSGIHHRHEWETEVSMEAVELDKLPEKMKASVFVRQRFCNSIVPVFNVRVERTLWDIDLANGDSVELCLDQGNVSTGSDRNTICEIELELKSGDASSLNLLALDLLDSIPLSLENLTKSRRGYTLLDPQLITYHKSDILLLLKTMTAEDVFIYSLYSCIEHLQSNEAITFQGGEPEGVHQMRVALRRLRSCLIFFKPLIPVDSYLELKQQIKWLSGLMGPVRDWDIFILSIEDMLEIKSKPSSVHQYLYTVFENAKKQQLKHSETLIRAMKSSQYTRLFLNLSLWLQTRPWRECVNNNQLKKLDCRVKRFTNKRLIKIYTKLIQYGGVTPSQLTPEDRHKVRIKSKELAYSLRFVSSLYPGAAAYLEVLSNLRDDLGMLNDNYTAESLMKTPDLLPANKAGDDFIQGWYAARETIALHDLDKNWPAFLLQPAITAKNR